MAWGPSDQAEGESTSSAWKFTYGEDPDLTDCRITVQALPPGNINVLSLGLKDETGKIMAWYWECGPAGSGKPLITGTFNSIAVDLALSGIAATTPPATSFVEEAGFDITRVVSLIADENNVWQQDQAVPPLGRTMRKAWNYWYSLSVAPPALTSSLPAGQDYKWRQPARYIGTGNYYFGWGDVSVDYQMPLLADDWKCEDDQEVIAINWWGAFQMMPPYPGMPSPGWVQPVLPSVPPTGFHIGIWSDVPGDLQDMTAISHPDQLIWEQVCTDYTWDFVGYDADSRIAPPAALPPAIAALIPPPPPMPTDACFRFSCNLDPNFAQNPGSNNVYWLSIAAIYDSGPPTFAWGWKTRQHYWNDGAVRITNVVSGTWPPTLGDQWSTGTAVEWVPWVPWDLTFELITAEAPPGP